MKTELYMSFSPLITVLQDSYYILRICIHIYAFVCYIYCLWELSNTCDIGSPVGKCCCVHVQPPYSWAENIGL
jgi:hypothetical protein